MATSERKPDGKASNARLEARTSTVRLDGEAVVAGCCTMVERLVKAEHQRSSIHKLQSHLCLRPSHHNRNHLANSETKAFILLTPFIIVSPILLYLQGLKA